jgi:hypothetical protein
VASTSNEDADNADNSIPNVLLGMIRGRFLRVGTGPGADDDKDQQTFLGDLFGVDIPFKRDCCVRTMNTCTLCNCSWVTLVS